MQLDLPLLAARIRRHPRVHGGNIVALGRLLLEAKALCPPGEFADWFRRCRTGFALRTAREAMLAARRLHDFPNLHRLSPAVLRLLSNAKVRKRPTIRQRIAELAAAGKVRWADARAVVSDVDPTVIYGHPGERVETPGEALARRLVELITNPSVSSIHIATNRDTEDEDGESVRLTVLNGVPKCITRRSIATALAAAVGEEALRHCKKCKRDLPPDAFSQQCRSCKRCERARVGEYKRKRKQNSNEGN